MNHDHRQELSDDGDPADQDQSAQGHPAVDRGGDRRNGSGRQDDIAHDRDGTPRLL
jgi:hypothetical protein